MYNHELERLVHLQNILLSSWILHLELCPIQEVSYSTLVLQIEKKKSQLYMDKFNLIVSGFVKVTGLVLDRITFH